MVNETGRRGNKSKEECHSKGDDQNTNTALVYRVLIARQMGGHLRPVVGNGDRERKCQSNHKRLLISPDQGLMYAVGAVGAQEWGAALRCRMQEAALLSLEVLSFPVPAGTSQQRS